MSVLIYCAENVYRLVRACKFSYFDVHACFIYLIVMFACFVRENGSIDEVHFFYGATTIAFVLAPGSVAVEVVPPNYISIHASSVRRINITLIA